MNSKINFTDRKAFTPGLAVMPVRSIYSFKTQGTLSKCKKEF
jgi:hypothetical protein